MAAPDTERTLSSRGRPPSTTRAQVSRTALELFCAHGFEQTTLADIAAALGIGRRTLFRYFASKNDMVWGDFDVVNARLRDGLAVAAADEPMISGLTHAVLDSHNWDPESLDELRLRMALIIDVPALAAHSLVRYAEWQRIVARFVAGRLGQAPEDIVPLLVAHMAFSASRAAYLRWVRWPGEDLREHLCTGYAHLALAFPG